MPLEILSTFSVDFYCAAILIKGPKERAAMTEIVFVVEEDPDGGLTAHAIGESIFSQAADMESLKEKVRDAVRCHFPDENSRPKLIRLHSVRDEVIAA